MTTLSGGEVQRVKLAMGVESYRPNLFLDKTTTSYLQDTQQLIDLFEGLVDKGNH